MQITLNIPDDLPSNIVQQYISTIEAQMFLMTKLTLATKIENKAVEDNTQKILNNFYNLPVSKIESIETKSVYQGKTLSLEDMEQAIEYEAGLHK
jgi:hypothetical protein